ncbi:hypothetical protein C8R43DRAFT_251881 [Mycena crocata]|nr:hypothetical protein C8R43DRAFT_251881 [Mycena crocata]
MSSNNTPCGCNQDPCICPPSWKMLLPGLITSPILDSVHLAVNTVINMFICTMCQTVHKPSGVAIHVKEHSLGLDKSVVAEIEKIRLGCNLTESFPEFDGPTDVIAGVRLKGGDNRTVGCPECLVCGTKSHVRRHRKSVGHDSDVKAVANVFYHQPNRGSIKHNVWVRPQNALDDEAVDEDYSALLREMLDFDWTTLRPDVDPDARQVSPWMQRTGWHLLTRGYDVADLRRLVAMPKKDDPEMPGLHALVDWYVEIANGLLENTSELVLQMLNSADPDKDGINNTPLHRHQQESSDYQYALPLVQLVATLLRCLAESEPDVEVYRVPTSPALTAALRALQTELIKLNGEVKRDKKCKTLPSRALRRLEHVFNLLWEGDWPRERGGPMADPTLCFLALSSLRAGGEFALPKDTTGRIAKLCRGIQFHVLVTIHYQCENMQETPLNVMEGLQVWVTEKKESTFARLMSLQHYASTLAFITMGMPSIWWLDRVKWDRLLYRGQEVSLENLQEIVGTLEDDILRMMREDVLLGQEHIRVDWKTLHDVLDSSENGYSFLSDEKNVFFDEHGQDLMNAILRNPVLRARFTYTLPDGKLGWNHHAMREFNAKVAETELCLMVKSDLSVGASPRGTELTSMLARNHALRSRNMMALAGTIGLFRKYTKTGNITQSDRLIPHALPAFVASCLVHIHLFARPLCQFFATKLYPTQPEIAVKYAEMVFMDNGCEFTSERLSSEMGQRSQAVLGWRMSIAPHRHINIAFRSKLCTGATQDLLEQEAASTVQALQSGHTLSTERKIYGLTPDALAGAPEDVIAIYLDISTEWQKVLRLIPGGVTGGFEFLTRDRFDGLVADGTITAAQQERKKLELITPGLDPQVSVLLDEFRDFRSSTFDFQSKSLANQEDAKSLLLELKQLVQDLRAERATSDVRESDLPENDARESDLRETSMSDVRETSISFEMEDIISEDVTAGKSGRSLRITSH